MKALKSANKENTIPNFFNLKQLQLILNQTSWLTAEATCNPIWMRSIIPCQCSFGGLGDLHPDVNWHDDDSDDDIHK